jgi:hypothetical protein
MMRSLATPFDVKRRERSGKDAGENNIFFPVTYPGVSRLFFSFTEDEIAPCNPPASKTLSIA